MTRQFILIDGRSGAGKTTYAEALARETGFTLVHLEDFYPGWGGLFDASRMVARDVLHPTNPGFTRWDWINNQPAEWMPIDPDASLIIEGVGAITEENLAAARRLGNVHTIKLVADADQRRDRALKRDPYFEEFWDMWAAQEREFYAGPGNVEADEIIRVG